MAASPCEHPSTLRWESKSRGSLSRNCCPTHSRRPGKLGGPKKDGMGHLRPKAPGGSAPKLNDAKGPGPRANGFQGHVHLEFRKQRLARYPVTLESNLRELRSPSRSNLPSAAENDAGHVRLACCEQRPCNTVCRWSFGEALEDPGSAFCHVSSRTACATGWRGNGSTCGKAAEPTRVDRPSQEMQPPRQPEMGWGCAMAAGTRSNKACEDSKWQGQPCRPLGEW